MNSTYVAFGPTNVDLLVHTLRADEDGEHRETHDVLGCVIVRETNDLGDDESRILPAVLFCGQVVPAVEMFHSHDEVIVEILPVGESPHDSTWADASASLSRSIARNGGL